MKKYILFLSYVMFVFSLNANDILANKISSVTLYRSGAYIKRVVEISLTQGQNSFKLNGLPMDIDPNSVVVKGYGNFIISGVQTSQNFLQDAADHEKVKPLLVKKKQFEKEIASLQADLEATKSWEDFLNQNKAVSSTQTPISSENFIKLEQNYRKNSREAKQNILSLKYLIDEKSKELEKISKEINQLSGEINTQTSEITINAESKLPQNAKIEVTYFTRMAYWIPKYRISVDEVSLPLTLNYQASISQMTGENWNKVELIFSSANPSNNQNLPTYSVLPLKFYEPIQYRTRSNMSMKKMEVAPMAMAAGMSDMKEMAVMADSPSVQYEDEANFFEYKLDQPYTLLTGDKNIEVTFHAEKTEATYLYKTLPYVDPTAYLIAKIADWQKLNILPGEATLYFNNSYVGKIYLDTKNKSLDSEISLGKDDRIVIVRKNLLGGKKSAGIMGNKTVQEYEWETKIINQRNKGIEIEIVDRTPLSKDNEIAVDFKAPEGVLYDETTGKLTWKIKIDPTQSSIVRLKYNIKFPKEKTIDGLPN